MCFGQFLGGISVEWIDVFDDVDIVVIYGGQLLWEVIKVDLLMVYMFVVQYGLLVMLGFDFLGMVVNFMLFLIFYVLEDYVDLLVGVVCKVDGQ